MAGSVLSMGTAGLTGSENMSTPSGDFDPHFVRGELPSVGQDTGNDLKKLGEATISATTANSPLTTTIGVEKKSILRFIEQVLRYQSFRARKVAVHRVYQSWSVLQWTGHGLQQSHPWADQAFDWSNQREKNDWWHNFIQRTPRYGWRSDEWAVVNVTVNAATRGSFHHEFGSQATASTPHEAYYDLRSVLGYQQLGRSFRIGSASASSSKHTTVAGGFWDPQFQAGVEWRQAHSNAFDHHSDAKDASCFVQRP